MTNFSQGLTPLVPANIESTSGTKFNDCIDYVASLLNIPSGKIYFTNVTANGANGTGLGNIIPRLNQLQNKSDELEYVFVTINSQSGASLRSAIHESSQPLTAPFHRGRVFGNPKIPHVKAVIYLSREDGQWQITRLVVRNLDDVPAGWYSDDPSITMVDVIGGSTPGEYGVLPYVSEEWVSANFFERKLANQIVDQLNSGKRQLIIQGPPGTGKTFFAKSFAAELAGSENVELVQFHPSYSYEDFVEGYRPKKDDTGQMFFELKPGILKRIAARASEEPEKNFILIIDEINRGNLSKIFGELLFLLEYRDESAVLQYAEHDDDRFTLPPNLFIVGTMNTSDRSIAVVDAALRRRFWFVEFHPDFEPTKSLLSKWCARFGVDQDICWIWQELNARIEDYDFKLGPSYFMRADIEAKIEVVWEQSILPLIREYYWNSAEEFINRFTYLAVASATMDVDQDKNVEQEDDAINSGEQSN